DQRGAEIPASLWYDQAGGDLVRDEAGNVTGGVRYGLIEHPLGQYLGAAEPGAVYGSMDLISADEFAETYGTRADYLELMQAFDAEQLEAGYLTPWGADYLVDVANELLDRIGVPDEPVPSPSGDASGDSDGSGGSDGADGSQTPGGSLPDTGANIDGLVVLALVMLLATGAGLLVLRRRAMDG